jgi:hypothetical protein
MRASGELAALADGARAGPDALLAHR